MWHGQGSLPTLHMPHPTFYGSPIDAPALVTTLVAWGAGIRQVEGGVKGINQVERSSMRTPVKIFYRPRLQTLFSGVIPRTVVRVRARGYIVVCRGMIKLLSIKIKFLV
jgi:hypothetical protein